MEAPTIRPGAAHDGDFNLTVLGDRLGPGDRAPEFSLDCLDGTGLYPVTLADSAGSVRIISVLNSIDTPVCDRQTRGWEDVAGRLEGVKLLTVSMDLPFALARWTAASTSRHQALSSHRNEDFGIAYGVMLAEWRALQRSVFVVDAAGTLVHIEYVADQATPPDLEAAAGAARQAVRSQRP